METTPAAGPGPQGLSLEELTGRGVSRSAERRIEVPAAVSVITGEDIRATASTRWLTPYASPTAVHVARFNGGSWGISTRGFTATTNNKLLVIIDGRSVYTPLFGGVFWEAQHTVLPDVERIEVIRARPARCGGRMP